MLQTTGIKELVWTRYGEFAETGGNQESCWASEAQPSSGYAVDQGLYTEAELALVPDMARNLSRGCGNPTGFATLQAGDVVVDFGCGGGIDVILSSHKVGAEGRVIGLDGAAQMIERAWQTVAEAGFEGRNIEFHVGDMANTGLPGELADVVISNCVINLVPDKDSVYEEAFRILRPGGQIAISDIVFTEGIASDLLHRFRSTWSGCVGGTIVEEDYWELLRQVGFQGLHIVSRHVLTPEELEAMDCCPGEEFVPPPSQEDLALVEGKVASVKFTAFKPLTAQRGLR